MKADTEMTAEDIAGQNLVLVGNPQNNAVLARIAGQLPVTWSDGGFKIGDAATSGPGAGLCAIFPNPESPGRYVVIISATDPAGYKVWDDRAGVDFVLIHSNAEGKPEVLTRGVFDNQWKFDPALRTTLATPAP